MLDCTCSCELTDLDASDKPAVNRMIPVNTFTHCEDFTGVRQKHITNPSMSDAIQNVSRF